MSCPINKSQCTDYYQGGPYEYHISYAFVYTYILQLVERTEQQLARSSHGAKAQFKAGTLAE